MAALSNAKWEAAAQDYVTNGNDKSAAYRTGFPKAKGKVETVNNNAYKLFNHTDVWARVEELQQKAAEVAEEEFQITTEWKQRVLTEVVERSLQHEEVKDHEGNGIGEYKFEGGTVVRAIDQLNKMDGGHAPTKSEIKATVAHELTDEQLLAIATRSS